MAKWLLLSVSASVLLAGCSIPQKKYYASFEADMATKAQVTIAVDTLFLRDIKGEMDGVNVQHSREMSEKIGVLVHDRLQGKGYPTNSRVLHSVGFIGGTQSHFIMLDPNNKSVSSEPAPTPYYYDPEPYPEPHKRTAARLFSRAFAVRLMKKGGDPLFDDITRLPLPPNEATVLIMVLARDVSEGKEFGQAMLTGLASMGAVTMYETDYSFIKMAILDNATGRVLWSDVRYTKDDPTEQSVTQQMKYILSSIPDRQGKPSPASRAPAQKTDATGGLGSSTGTAN